MPVLLVNRRALAPQTTTHPAWWRISKLLLRLIFIGVFTFGFGWFLNRSVTKANDGVHNAGFTRGMLHGALMPGAMPSLMLGRDVVIYAEKNSGRMYKLGYTVGVNVCGALFFGVMYFRVSRWRKKL